MKKPKEGNTDKLNISSLKDKKPLKEKKKDLYVFIIIASFGLSALMLYSFLTDSDRPPLELPTIYIDCDEKITEFEYVNCTFELVDFDLSNEITPLESKIKYRGDLNARRKKKGYRLELSKKKSLLGMRTDDDWALFALYRDPERMRNKLSIELWRELLPTNPTAILPDSEYVSLFLNDEFQGLYLLVEKNDKKLFDLDEEQNNIYSSLIFQAKEPTRFREYDPNSWEQDWPNEDDDIFIMDEIMTELFYFVNNTPNDIFFDSDNGIYTKFVKINLIDFYLFNFFILHKDFWYNNYFIIRNSYPNKFFLGPWDFDDSFGHTGPVEFNASVNPEPEIREMSELYNRLLDNTEFRSDCKNRWNELRETLWTEEFILSTLTEIYSEIEHILELELLMWNPDIIEDDFDLNDYVSHLFQWILDRLIFTDLYFNSLA